ncbi:MAG: hypothetical protein H6Q13_459 [Bacteroidetes bacterium]|jgi:hypothetical protein|nr:hypothetical protein [Bacteroidota bacterium]
MPINVVKSFHHHNETIQTSSQHQSSNATGHEHHDCPICDFTLSPFIQTESIHLTFIAELLPYTVPTYQNKRTFNLSYSHGLRAPPTIA